MGVERNSHTSAVPITLFGEKLACGLKSVVNYTAIELSFTKTFCLKSPVPKLLKLAFHKFTSISS